MIQASLNINTRSPFLNGSFKSQSGTYAQDAAETVAVADMTVLGKILFAAGTAAAGTNTGNGTVSAFALAAGEKKIGTYKFILTAALVGKIVDPDGNDIKADIALTDGDATVISAGGITFTITDGATAFVAGDSFNLPVASGSLKFKATESDGVDGSEIPAGIYHGAALASDDIVAGDVPVYEAVIGGNGVAVEDNVVFHNGTDTLDKIVYGKTYRDYLAALGLFFQSIVDTEEYENA